MYASKNQVATARRTLPFLIRNLVKNWGIKVRFGNSGSHTDGEMVMVHLPFDADMDTITIAKGSAVHEASHIKFTDFDYWQSFCKQNPSLQRLLNAIEDPRIDLKMSQVHLGVGRMREEALSLFVKQGEIITGEGSPKQALMAYVHFWGRWHILDQAPAEALLKSAEAELTKYLDKTGMMRLEALLASNYYNLSSTEEAGALTLKVWKLIEDLAEEQKQQPKQDGSNSGNSGDDSDSSDDTDSTGAPSDDSSDGEGDSEGESDSGDTDDDGTDEEDSDSDNSGSAGGEEEGDDSDEASAPAQQILDDDNDLETDVVDLKAYLDQLVGDQDDGRPFTNDSFNTEGMVDGTATPEGVLASDHERLLELAERMTGQTRILSQDLIAELEALTRSSARNTTRGKLQPKKLWKSRTGDYRVFRKVRKGLELATAVSVVADLSGSMGSDSRAEYCAHSMVALGDTLDTVGIPFEMLGFRGMGWPNGYHCELVPFKTFEDDYMSRRASLGGLEQSVGGGTPLTEAMWEAGCRLLEGNQDRKMLIVLTDGDPDDSNSTSDMLGRLQSDGIEIYGIGMKTAYGEQLFPHWETVIDLDELAHTLISCIRNGLQLAA